MKSKITILALLIIALIITCIHPIFPDEQYLQHLGTLILLIVLTIDLRKNRLSVFAYSCFAGFILIHIIGARYIYSYVPYDKWLNQTAHLVTNESFHFSGGRNHYDRFVHLFFGILIFPFLYEILDRQKIGNRCILLLTVWSVIQAASMVYELFEWSLTLVLSNEAANDYNGQQGDMWDAQKDMFLALVGSTIMLAFFLLKKKRH